MTVLVTGGTGFIGAAILRNLIGHGQAVRALVRPASDRRNLEGLPVEIVEGDLRDADAMRRALQGARELVHAAADYRLWARHPRNLYETNVQATEQLMRLALDAGLERIVHTSSVATLKLRGDGQPSSEKDVASVQDMVGHYKRSKFLAEEVVRTLHEAHGLPVVIVNPAAPVGPGDVRPTPTGRTIVDAANGRIPAYLNTGLDIVHVDDVAEGHFLALRSGEFGRRYVLSGTPMSLKQILAEVAALVGRRPPLFRMPYAVAWLAGAVSEAFARVSGGEPGVPLEGVLMARKFMYFSSVRAETELGYRTRSAATAIADAVDWFQAHGYLTAGEGKRAVGFE